MYPTDVAIDVAVALQFGGNQTAETMGPPEYMTGIARPTQQAATWFNLYAQRETETISVIYFLKFSGVNGLYSHKR